MNNLEFYKDEIINSSITEVFIKYTGRVQHSHGECIEWLLTERTILDKEEKEYLSVVIIPFRNKVSTIEKKTWHSGNDIYECLKIKFNQPIGSLVFPLFKQGTKYKGMKANKDYTLKELGL